MRSFIFSASLAIFVTCCITFGCAQTKQKGHSSQLMDATGNVPTQNPRFKKVMIVFYENQPFSKAQNQPNFKIQASQGALLANFYAETHPSQPNYIALISGDTQGVTDDENHDLSGKTIADLLEAKGKTWKNYAEDFPGNCFTGKSSGRYVRKHTPFISFKSIQSNPSRCKNIAPAEELAKDVRNGTVPDFSIYTPNMDNDGHDRGLAFADQSFNKTFSALLKNPIFMRDMLFILTFDEDDRKEGNQIFTAFYGASIKPGSVNKQKLNHYSLLKLVEDEWGLGDLGLKDRSAPVITDIWAN